MTSIFSSITNWQLATYIISILLGISTLVPKVRQVLIKPVVRRVVIWFRAPTILEDIQKQLYNNGGSSLRDAVDALKLEVMSIDATLKARHLLESEAWFWTDPEGKFISANSAFFRLFNCTLEDVTGYNFKRLLNMSHSSQFFQDYLASIELKCDFVQVVPARDIHGVSLGDICFHAVPKKRRDGTIVGWEGLIKHHMDECQFALKNPGKCAYLKRENAAHTNVG